MVSGWIGRALAIVVSNTRCGDRLDIDDLATFAVVGFTLLGLDRIVAPGVIRAGS